jgi:superoxide dismutase
MYYIKAHRGAGSVLGEASSLLKRDGIVQEFTSKEEAQNEVKRLNKMVRGSPWVWYTVAR